MRIFGFAMGSGLWSMAYRLARAVWAVRVIEPHETAALAQGACAFAALFCAGFGLLMLAMAFGFLDEE